MADVHGERIAVVEQRVEGLVSKVDKLDTTSEALVELKTIVKMQSEFQERMHVDQKEQMSKFSVVLESVNTNLSHLNTKYDQMETNMESMGNEVKSIKKSQAESQEKTKIDTGQLVKNIILGLLMLVVTVAGAWLLKVTGLR